MKPSTRAPPGGRTLTLGLRGRSSTVELEAHVLRIAGPSERRGGEGTSDPVRVAGVEPALPEAAGLQPAAHPHARHPEVRGLGRPPRIGVYSSLCVTQASGQRASRLVGGRDLGCQRSGGPPVVVLSRDVGFRTPSTSVLETDRLPKPHPLGWLCFWTGEPLFGASCDYQRKERSDPGRVALAHPGLEALPSWSS